MDESLPSGFYKWENHKVVAYGGKFYDPSYGCQYENLADMVCLEIEEYGISGSGAVDYQFWDSKADTDADEELLPEMQIEAEPHLLFQSLAEQPAGDGLEKPNSRGRLRPCNRSLRAAAARRSPAEPLRPAGGRPADTLTVGGRTPIHKIFNVRLMMVVAPVFGSRTTNRTM